MTVWGPYYKYNYVKFDFTAVREPGVYYIQYGQTRTGDFLIDEHVYDKITDATTDVWVPIHMDHMMVREGYRIWHGEPFKEGYLQAPPSDRPKQVFYGNNRADFSAIPGNVAPGLLFRKPDHFENFDDWPFLWGQNEGNIGGNTQYIIFASSLKNIAASGK